MNNVFKNLFCLILLLGLMMPSIVFAEESQDGEEADSEAVMEAQNRAIEVALRSLKRWNKIIELKNYIAETDAMVWLQNFRSGDLEDDEE